MNKTDIDMSSIIITVLITVFGMILIFTLVAPFEQDVFLALGVEDVSFSHDVYKFLGSTIAFSLSILTAFGISKLWKRFKKQE